MIEFINSLNLDDNTKKALIGAYSQEKNKFENEKKSLEEDFKKEKDKLQNDFTTFKESVKDHDLLKQQIKTLQESEATLKAENEKINKNALSDKLNFAIEKELMTKNARHVDLLKNAIDRKSIEYDTEKGEFKGLKEAIQKTEEQYKDLFGQLPINSQKSATQTSTTQTIDPTSIKTANDWLGLINRK